MEKHRTGAPVVVNGSPIAADNRFARIIDLEEGQVVLMVDQNQQEDNYELIANAYDNGMMVTVKGGYPTRELALRALDEWDEQMSRTMFRLMHSTEKSF